MSEIQCYNKCGALTEEGSIFCEYCNEDEDESLG